VSNGIHGGGQSPVLANRFVLLGASNLTVSLRLVIQLLQRRIGGPSDVLVAAGHGRSYGEFSQVMFRELPGITSSGLWKRLELDNVRPTLLCRTVFFLGDFEIFVTVAITTVSFFKVNYQS